jgi:hypothetical protein
MGLTTNHQPTPRLIICFPHDGFDQLDEHPLLLFAFLHALFLKNPVLGKDFHNRQVRLYADYGPELLGNFLASSNF